jgi:hypothetical protein
MSRIPMSREERASLKESLIELEVQHRDLDQIIARLVDDRSVDQLQLRRLKKRKLLLKDQIARVKSLLIPDLDA